MNKLTTILLAGTAAIAMTACGGGGGGTSGGGNTDGGSSTPAGPTQGGPASSPSALNYDLGNIISDSSSKNYFYYDGKETDKLLLSADLDGDLGRHSLGCQLGEYSFIYIYDSNLERLDEIGTCGRNLTFEPPVDGKYIIKFSYPFTGIGHADVFKGSGGNSSGEEVLSLDITANNSSWGGETFHTNVGMEFQGFDIQATYIVSNNGEVTQEERNVTKFATYTSSDESIATITNDGKIKAISEGDTTIEVSLGDKSEIYYVYVSIENLIVTPSISTGYVGGIINFEVLQGENNVTNLATYTSSNESVATISNGRIEAVSEGDTTIEISHNDAVKTYNFRVGPAIVKDFIMTPSDVIIDVGDKLVPIFEGLMSDGTRVPISNHNFIDSKSSDSAIAEYEWFNNEIKGLSSGTTTIEMIYHDALSGIRIKKNFYVTVK